MTPAEYEEVRQEVLAVCREKVAAMMIRLSIATGHGDTIDDLLCELEAAVKAIRRAPQSMGYWIYETSGVLRPAVEAYLRHENMTPEQIAAMRAYLRQWIFTPVWRGDELNELRRGIDGLTSRAAINAWLDAAEMMGIDPL